MTPKAPIRIGLLLMAMGVLLTSTATAQPRRGGRSGSFPDRLQAMLERIDTNKDGVVTRDEFKGSPDRFSMMDSNGDDKIDDTDVAAMRKRHRQSLQRGGNRRGGGRRGPDALTQRHGADKSPELGEAAPDFTLKLLGSDEEVTLSEVYRDKPVVLTLGSYTCPPFRQAIEGIEELYQQYDDQVAFCFVYIKEAHATDERPAPGNQRIGIDFTQPTTYDEREHIAATCQRQIELTMPILVDTLDNEVARLYAGAPNRTYLIDRDGTVLYKGQRGPRGTNPDEVVRAIKERLHSNARLRSPKGSPAAKRTERR